MMYLARRSFSSRSLDGRRSLDADTVWLHLIDDHELFAARSVDCAGMQVKRVPHAWDWHGPLGSGVSAIGETEEQALALLAERERLVADVEAAVSGPRGRRRTATDKAATGCVEK